MISPSPTKHGPNLHIWLFFGPQNQNSTFMTPPEVWSPNLEPKNVNQAVITTYQVVNSYCQHADHYNISCQHCLSSWKEWNPEIHKHQIIKSDELPNTRILKQYLYLDALVLFYTFAEIYFLPLHLCQFSQMAILGLDHFKWLM